MNHKSNRATITVRSGFKFRLYPTIGQQSKLAVQFGCTRFVYNKMLAYRRKGYRQFGRSIRPQQCITFLARLKKTTGYAWLKAADSQALQQAVMDLNHAFDRFFKGQAGTPKFKKKQGKQSYRYPQRFKLEGNRIYLPKVGWVRLVRHRALQGKMKSCTVSRTRTGQYFVSILCEYEKEPAPASGSVGIDLGLSHFLTLSTGEKVANPRHLRKQERRLRIRQRRLSRKQKGSRNRQKARQRVAVQQERVANQRRDFHHQVSRTLVNRYGVIAFEDLPIKGMLANHRLAKSIADAGWSQFVTFVQYKQQWAGGDVVQADRWFPSSRTCSVCGTIRQSLALSERMWTCTACGTAHDRDTNAAQNLLHMTTVGATESYALYD
jgi:putative transposase